MVRAHHPPHYLFIKILIELTQIDLLLYYLYIKKKNNNMKNLTEYIKESLVVNEGNQVFVWSLDHDSPETLHVGFINKSDVSNLRKRLKDYDVIFDTENIKTRFVYVDWNDERCIVCDLGNDLKKIWKDVENSAEKALNSRQTEEDDEWWEWDNIFGVTWCSDDFEDEPVDSKILTQKMKDYITHSYVDGDSNSCAAILDLQNKSIELKGDDHVEFTDFTTYPESSYDE